MHDRDAYLTTFDKLFDDMFRSAFPEMYKSIGVESMSNGYPKVNVLSYPTHLLIETEVVGLTKDDLNIEVSEGILTISGRVDQTTEEADKGVYLYRELKRGAFSRSFKLGTQLSTDKIDAEFKNGLLKITIPKSTPPEPVATRIAIK